MNLDIARKYLKTALAGAVVVGGLVAEIIRMLEGAIG